jgi:phosphate-selective porin OprO/OprP
MIGAGTPAFADDAAVMRRLDEMQRMIEAQQKQISSQQNEIRSLRHALGQKPPKSELARAEVPARSMDEQLAQHQQQIDKLTVALDNVQLASKLDKQDQPTWNFAGGRPTITSPDGRFSMAIRILGQFDLAYYDQADAARNLAAANGPDLSSGANFRRAQIGLQGKLFGDWSYFFNTEFGGSNGFESQGRIQTLYIQYDGLKPWAFRIGAYPPPAGLEDGTSSADTIFLERTAPSDILRNAMGGDGRDAASVMYTGEEFFAALSWTGAKVADAATFDEQNAVLARIADSFYSDADSRFVLSASAGYIFKVADTTSAVLSPRSFTVSSAPELTVDSTGAKLVSTGAIDTNHVFIWGAEAGGQWKSLYAQGGYFQYTIDQRLAGAPTLDFDGWYAQASWVITGENKGYNTTNGAFVPPKPRIPFSFAGGGWGAWELAARYSDVNLDDNAGVAGLPVPLGGIRGGDQRIFTLGLNWYPNSSMRFLLDWQNIKIDRLGTIPGPPIVNNTQVGQTINAYSLRSQISL